MLHQMHIPLAKLTMTSLKESFCPVKKITSCKIYPLPIQQFLVVASFILCLIQLSTLHFECCCCYCRDFLRVASIIYFLIFLMIHTFRFLFFQIVLVTSFQIFVNLWRHYYAILLFEFFIIWTIKLLYTCTYMYKYSPVYQSWSYWA